MPTLSLPPLSLRKLLLINRSLAPSLSPTIFPPRLEIIHRLNNEARILSKLLSVNLMHYAIHYARIQSSCASCVAITIVFQIAFNANGLQAFSVNAILSVYASQRDVKCTSKRRRSFRAHFSNRVFNDIIRRERAGTMLLRCN